MQDKCLDFSINVSDEVLYDLMDIVASEAGMTRKDLQDTERSWKKASARWMYTAILKDRYPYIPFRIMVKILNKKDHTTIIYGLDRHVVMMEVDEAYKGLFKRIEKRVWSYYRRIAA